MTSTEKLVVLHVGDDAEFNPELHKRFCSLFTIIRPSIEERQRPAFLQALKDRKWGDFHAVYRPHWNTGGEMGRWDRELVPLLPKSMKIFASAGAGYDWADVDVLAEQGILYCNSASASSEAVADTALFHIISVFRNFAWSTMAARSGDPEQWTEAHKYATVTAHNPRGHTLGIIGLGNIGYTIAKKVYAACEMEIYYYDSVRKLDHLEKAVNATYVPDLDELLGQVDCVLLMTPFGGKKLITRETLLKFKKGSRFVNVARGTLVDEEALVESLKSGHLFAAGLDVYENEPHIHPELVRMRNVSLTCHTAGAARETWYGFERLGMENIMGYLLEGKAVTPVNLHLLKK